MKWVLAKEGRKKENPISSIYNTCINSIVSLALHAFFREAVTPDIETKEKTWAKIQMFGLFVNNTAITGLEWKTSNLVKKKQKKGN